MILTHWDALDRQSLQAPAGLQTPKPASEALQRAFCHHFGLSACPGLLFSGKATLERWPLLKTGDVVRLHPEGVAEVLFHCMYADMLLTCVSLYEPTKVPQSLEDHEGSGDVFSSVLHQGALHLQGQSRRCDGAGMPMKRCLMDFWIYVGMVWFVDRRK